MFKLIEFDRFRPDGMEVIFPIDLERPMRKQAACSKHVKIAAPVKAFCDAIEPHPDRAYFLNVALGAGETWGMNKNGDWFPREELAVENPQYGYTTFLKAGRFRHHVNKDPELSLGKVVYAFWNQDMDRAELVSWIERAKAPDVADRIDNLEKTGEDIGTSMGCRVPYDVCSICHHKAASAKKYCTHLKTAMGRVMTGGKAVYAHNVRPFFFDDSFVILKAANEAGVTMKVASASNRPGPIIISSADRGLEVYGEDKSAGPKSSAIRKEVPGTVEALTPEEQARIEGGRRLIEDLAPVIEGNQKPMPGEKVAALACFPMDKVAATSAFMGIVLTPEEFQKIALCSQGGHGPTWASALEADGIVFDPDMPEVLDWEEKQGEVASFSIDDVDEKVASVLSPLMPDRSYWEPHFSNRLEKWAGFGSSQRVQAAFEREQARQEKRADSAVKSLLPIALGYALYRMQLGKQTPGMIDRFITKKPAIAIPILGGLAAGGLALLEPPPGKEPPGIADVHIGGIRANEKMAGIATRFVLPGFAPFVYSSELKRQERQRGYPHQGFKGFAKEHPAVLGLLSIGAAGTLANKYKAVAKAGKSMARRLAKTGSAEKTTGQTAESAVSGAAKMVASGLYKARHFPGALLDELVLSRLLHAAGSKG